MTSIASESELPVLEALAEEPSLSQRELARRAGLSLSRAHFVLRRLVEKGLVKVHNATQSDHKLGYLYLLTPSGLEAKAKLTYAFLQHSAQRYQEMVARVESVLEPVLQSHNGDPVRVAVVGNGALSEVVTALISRRGDAIVELELPRSHVVVVTDPEVSLPATSGVTVVRLA